MTDSIELELLQPSVCLPPDRPVIVLVRVRNHGRQAADVGLEVRGRLSDTAGIEPAEVRLDPGESRLVRVRFGPVDGVAGPMPYAIAAASGAGDRPRSAAFGLVDVHRTRAAVRTGGSAVPQARTA